MKNNYILSAAWIDGYSKRAARIDTKGGRKYIRSYNTLVGFVDRNGKLHRFWDGYSATTLKHINLIYPDGINKKEWLSLKIEKMDDNAKAINEWFNDNVGTCIFKYNLYGNDYYNGFEKAY